MTDPKRESVVGPTGGAVAGSVAGATIGVVLGGPLGLVVGAAAGAVTGAVVGKKIDTELEPQVLHEEGDIDYLRENYYKMPYYINGMGWEDYDPAYRYAIDTYTSAKNKRFEDAEPDLARNWEAQKEGSRLTWAGAYGPVRHIWQGYDRGQDPLE
jgi:hypothetical protein